MKPLFSRSIKAGLLAIGLSAGLSLPALAGPMPQPIPSVPGVATSTIVPVRDSWAGGNDNRVSDWRWRKRHHSRHRHWRGPRHYQHRRHYRRNWHGGSGFFLGFGLGAPYYRDNYYRPRYRVYRGGNAHVRWCYAHYRSYRASDNTFQPYNGRRRQCRSPY